MSGTRTEIPVSLALSEIVVIQLALIHLLPSVHIYETNDGVKVDVVELACKMNTAMAAAVSARSGTATVEPHPEAQP